MTVEQDRKAQEQCEIIKQLAIEEKITNLGAHITNFEHQDNFVRLDFDSYITLDKVSAALESLGITEIINKYTNGITKSEIRPVFVLNYQYAKQKNIINDLEHEFIRMNALKKLFEYGGFKLSHSEQKYFDEQAARVAAIKMAGKTK